MTARYATADEMQNWNNLILANPDGGNVFSSFEYSQIKELTNYKPRYIVVENTAITVLEKSVWPLGKFWYLPKGPGVANASQLIEAVASLKPLAKKAGVFMIRTESELPKDSEDELKQAGLLKATPIIPNASTITLNIEPPYEDLLASLPQKGRHAIRRAERDGAIVKKVEVTPKNSKIMYKLLEETASGQFGIRSLNYYKTYWEIFAQAGYGQLFFAYYEDKVVAGAYAMVFGSKSTYKDGASIRERTAYGASHLLQWHVINWAKDNGAKIHDLCGSPPSDQINNTSHPHYGIGRFKQSLSRNVIDYIGCYDYLISPLRYSAWKRAGEKIHRHIYYKRTKDYFY